MFSVSNYLEVVKEENGGPATNQSMQYHGSGDGSTSKESVAASALDSTMDRTEAGANKGPAIKQNLRFHSLKGAPDKQTGANSSKLNSIPSETMQGQAPPES